MRSVMVAVVLATFASLAARPADACLHAAGATPEAEPITQRGQQAIILHDGETEDLILRVEYEGADTASLAWIVPVPSMPTAYEAMDAALFDDVAGWVQLQRVQPPIARAASADGGAKSAPPSPQALLKMGPPAKVGPFAIQPIGVAEGADNEAGGEALNAWMREHGFAEIPASGLAYYVERGWTFVAVKIDPEGGAGKLAAEGGLPPLRLTFASESAVYPLKLSTHMGQFAARVYLVTSRALDATAVADLPSKGFEAVVGGDYKVAPRQAKTGLETAVTTFAATEAPRSLAPLLTTRFAGGGELHMNVLLSELVNSDDEALFGDAEGSFRPADWREDLAVPPLPAKADAAPAQPEARAPAVDPDANVGPVLRAENSKAPADGAKAAKAGSRAKPSAPGKSCACETGRDAEAAPWWLAAVVVTLRRRRRRR